MATRGTSQNFPRPIGFSPQTDKLFQKGQTLLRKNNFSKAIRTLRKAAKQTPESPKVLRYYATALSRNNDHIEALKQFELADALDPTNRLSRNDATARAYADSLSYQASNLGRSGNYEAAMPLYEKALALKQSYATLKNYAMTVQGLAQELSNHYQYQEALELLLKALEYKPNDYRLCTTCANTAVEVGNLDLAFELLDRCLLQAGNDALALTSYGNALTANGRYEEAYACFVKVLSQKSNNVPTITSYGNALAAEGRYEE
ncbi:MAG: tetratricopeptide repeat protein [Cyanobacteria bacterium P01_A01_bin.114]